MSNAVQNSPLVDLSDALAQAVAGAAPHVIGVRSHRSRSSGFVWRAGLIVTADEALAEDGEIEVALPGGETVGATLAGRDPTTDVALLRIERNDLAPIELHTEPVKAGALALAVVGPVDLLGGHLQPTR